MNRRSLFTIVPGSVLGLNGAVAPSNKITLATIGVGGMGTGHLQQFLKMADVRVAAVCDVEDKHLVKAKALVDERNGSLDCVTYRSFEEVLMRSDIDAVTIATPDHWHGIVAVQAARAGKDIYGEKPLAHNFREGQAMVEAVAKHKRIWQTGSWQRSRPNFRQACELVRNGRIGKVHTVEVGLPGGPDDYSKLKPGEMDVTAPPKTLHYDRWLGPAPEAPYSAARVHFNWRWNLDYGGGQLMDWVGHHVDIAHWGLGLDNTGPVEIEGTGEYPAKTEVWNSAKRYRIDANYPGGLAMVIAGGHKAIRGGTKWIGDRGWIWVDRGGLEASAPEILKSEIGPNENRLKVSDNHYAEFIECVKSRNETLTPAHVAHRSATPGWLGQIAMLTGRKLRWDPAKQVLLGDAAAEKLLGREGRPPYRL